MAVLLCCCGAPTALVAVFPTTTTTTSAATPTTGQADFEPTTTAPTTLPTTTTAAARGDQVLVAVRARGVDVGEVRDNTDGCQSYRCRRLTTTDVLSVYEFEPGADADAFAQGQSGSMEVHRRDGVFVRLAEGGSTPAFDRDAVRAALAEIGYGRLAASAPSTTAAPPPPPPPPTPTPIPAPTRPPAPLPAPAPSDPPVRDGVTAGAFCSPAGAVGRTSTGKLMTCKSSGADPRNRWRA